MAVPDSLTGWRDFVTHRNTEPERLSTDQITALSADDRETYDEARFAWIGADVVVDTKDITAVTHQVRLLRARLAANRSTAGRTLAISGRAGVGKSTIAMLLGKKHETAVRRKLGLPADDLTVAPVVYLVVPPGCTPKMLMSAVSRWIGLPVRRGWDAPTITDHVVAVLRDLKTSMIIVDEVHNLRTNSSAGAEAASTLKAFTERLDAAVIFCGIDLLDSDLLAGEMGRQIRARTKIYDLRAYGYGSVGDREAWLELVAGMEALLPLAAHVPGTLTTEDMAAYLWNRTGGSIGSLRNLLGDAAIEAILSGSEKLTRAGLDDVILDQEAVRGQSAVSSSMKPTSLKGNVV
ncbi:MAG TPA: TniB family NTP-binding protein [Candidatus Corynebacterium avicola]|uniref:TniB family NTP-binding protein n=1 Tax=Candidatus Corynebacterium avicola TaxID=2838527 RepID=A0A9D1RR44_9CORY|nr:TniB family NTP-binding protein [Candidatus Corynebacterium avicola]